MGVSPHRIPSGAQAQVYHNKSCDKVLLVEEIGITRTSSNACHVLPDERGFSALIRIALHVLVSTGVSALPPPSVQSPSFTLTYSMFIKF